MATENTNASDKPDVDRLPGEAAAAPEAAGGGEQLPELTIGSGAPAGEEFRDPNYSPVIRGRVDRFGVAMGTGRRKTAVARVRVRQGSGQLTINERTLDDFFRVERDRLMIEAPLRAADMQGKVDVWVRVDGGGTTGQAGAVVLGIARALQALNPDLHHTLSDGGFLTRDSRMVERKKYGKKKARRSFQFSKR
jgi:small subunit ribosomal protein S9